MDGWFPLNVDGSSRGNPGLAGGGGVCRAEDGHLLFGFYAGYGRASNTRAEVRAVHDGLVHCINQGLKNIILESDSSMVVSFLSGTSRSGWKWKCWLHRIRVLCTYGNVQFQHICREGNGPADVMANLGCGKQEPALFTNVADLPQVVRGLLFLDKVGLGTVRKKFKN